MLLEIAAGNNAAALSHYDRLWAVLDQDFDIEPSEETQSLAVAIKLQTAGLTLGYDQTVLRGDPETRKFTVVYMKEGKPIAFDCVGTMKDYVQARKLLESGAGKIDPALLADPEVAIQDLM